MTVSEATGDLFDPESWTNVTVPCEFPVDALGHGVNCKGAMGSGIAVEFRRRFPVMYNIYNSRCVTGWLLPGQVYPYRPDQGPVVFNIASQFFPGKDARLDALEVGLLYCRFYMHNHDLHHLALPRIGAGIGGLDWWDVKALVEDVFYWEENIHVTLVSLEGA